MNRFTCALCSFSVLALAVACDGAEGLPPDARPAGDAAAVIDAAPLADAAPPPVDAGPVSFATDVKPIFVASCSCHTSDHLTGLDLQGDAFAMLVGVAASTGPCGAGGANPLPRVDPLQPADGTKSALLQRLKSSACGPRMPFGGGALDPAKVAIIEAWIAGGALND